MCAKFQVKSPRNGWVLIFGCWKMTSFHVISCDLFFPWFSDLSICADPKCSSTMFCTMLTKNWPKNMHHTIQARHFQFDLFSFDTVVVRDKTRHNKLPNNLIWIWPLTPRPATVGSPHKLSTSIERRSNFVNWSCSSWHLREWTVGVGGWQTCVRIPITFFFESRSWPK